MNWELKTICVSFRENHMIMTILRDLPSWFGREAVFSALAHL
jgi:hypothetical protein